MVNLHRSVKFSRNWLPDIIVSAPQPTPVERRINVLSEEDVEYFERRAEAEIELARSAKEPPVVQAHYQLACAYLDRIYPEAAEARQG
jgi:hypothetical protein